jgi:hypothetical protein
MQETPNTPDIADVGGTIVSEQKGYHEGSPSDSHDALTDYGMVES